jgi:hypothetical protein
MTYNISMSELPYQCQSCGVDNMRVFSSFEKRMVDRVATDMGFICANCGTWVHVYYTTPSLDDAMLKLENRSNSWNFLFHFAKTLKKSEGIQERYGAF